MWILSLEVAKMIEFTAKGLPVPQGSTKSYVVNGHVVTAHDAKGLAQWRQIVAFQAQSLGATILDGPVRISLVFTLQRPKTLPKRIQYPAKRPDLDKLIRSVLDAITHILIVDDSQVVDIFAVKLYATPSVGPGVKVKLEEVNPLVRLDIPPILGIP